MNDYDVDNTVHSERAPFCRRPKRGEKCAVGVLFERVHARAHGLPCVFPGDACAPNAPDSASRRRRPRRLGARTWRRAPDRGAPMHKPSGRTLIVEPGPVRQHCNPQPTRARHVRPARRSAVTTEFEFPSLLAAACCIEDARGGGATTGWPVRIRSVFESPVRVCALPRRCCGCCA